MKTHVEFEDANGAQCIMPVEAVSLLQGPTGGWYVEHSRNTDWNVCIAPSTAARLRRELLGEGEPSAAEPGFVLEGYVVTNSSGAAWSGVYDVRADAESRAAETQGFRVVELYRRREDARP